MVLTKKVLEILNDNPKVKTRLAAALDKSIYTIQKYIKDNDDELTKAAALDVIEEVTGMSREEILTEKAAA